MKNKLILALVGMPGAGKSEVAAYLEKKGIPFVRFGKITEEEVTKMKLPLTQANEKLARERIRNEEGMGAYAQRAKPKIEELLRNHNALVIDGLYSWEEFLILKREFSGITLIHIFAEPKVRYGRLAKRPIRSLPVEDGFSRDAAEIEKLNKGGPIALADYLIENNGEDISMLYKKVDELMSKLTVSNSQSKE